MENPLGFTHFLQHADPIARTVLAMLVMASIGSWYLIVTKGLQGVRVRRRSEAFLAAFWEAPNLEALAARIREKGTTDPFSHLLHHGFTAIEQFQRGKCGNGNTGLLDAGTPEDMLSRALKRAIDEDRSQLEFGQTFLATVASSAPFVGLFGTVYGIYQALIAIGISGQGTLDKVAGPVGEALIMTGIGLAVAIPAAVAYNAFARANRNTLSRLNSFAYDVFSFLATGIKSSPMRSDARSTSEKMIELVRAQSGTLTPQAPPGLSVR
ncbi:MAG: MotA/TolQ/ExbB proton channel family protein [Zoogloeaceae bacterium]|nr:MotA/TolQ/ExbB proton channel family protein [Zoogloeaceae bacterium]